MGRSKIEESIRQEQAESSGNGLWKAGKVFTEKQETLSTESGAHSEQPQNEQEKLTITLPLGLSVQHLLPAQEKKKHFQKDSAAMVVHVSENL